MTDEKVFTAMTFGKTEVGELRTSEQVLIQCQGDKGVVLVLKLPEFATTTTRTFMFRIDEQKPYTHAWRVNRDRPGEYFVSNLKDLVRLTDPMFKGKLLRIRAEGGRSTYSFSLDGFADSMANIDHCTN